MTVIVLQAGAAQRVWARDPAAARIAVDALTGVARETLAELRVTLRAADDAAPRGSTRSTSSPRGSRPARRRLRRASGSTTCRPRSRAWPTRSCRRR